MAARKFSSLFSSPVVVAGMFTISAAIIGPLVSYWLPEKPHNQPTAIETRPSPVFVVQSEAQIPTKLPQQVSSTVPAVPQSSSSPSETNSSTTTDAERQPQVTSNQPADQEEAERVRLRNLHGLKPLTLTDVAVSLRDVPLKTYGFAKLPTINDTGHFDVNTIALRQSPMSAIEYEYHKKPTGFGSGSDFIVGFYSGNEDGPAGFGGMCHLTLYNKRCSKAQNAIEVDLGRIPSADNWRVETLADNQQVAAWHIAYSQP